MSASTCTIEQFCEAHQAIWLQDGTGDDGRFKDICVPLGLSSADAHSVAALRDAVERAATDRKLDVRSYPGPSHGDPYRNTFRVGVFTEPLAEWAPPDDGDSQ